MITELIQKLRSLAVQPKRARAADYEADLERKFAALRPNLSPSEVKILQRNFLGRFSPMLSHLVPVELLRVLQELIKGTTPKMICDPWAGIGLVVAAVREIAEGAAGCAITRSQSEARVGKILAPEVDWKIGDPLEELRKLKQPIDLAVGILPFGSHEMRSERIRDKNGDPVNLRTDLGSAILLSALTHLSADGTACFVVTPSFFFSARSSRSFLGDFGCYLSAVFGLPAGMFAPHTQIVTNLIVITKRQTDSLFAA